ncbi:ankyrin repeat domain-containing protein [uncultured Aquimarina sp.]|uniref:ankyrin repeat domain-containing protein n=1 Tax=uncultured Aquimarina sp. TaxID=575652 RepID=UPI00261FD295|nr:ankyrin repeat domain-containing protein [uncultured Aquimarina sp.]
MNRKQFLRSSIITTGVLAVAPYIGYSNPQDEPQLNKKIVQEFVGAGHGKFDKVKELLEEYPTLINAAHDWKYGDFETALGAASHVGHKELATYLINKGAQANIFTAALFGKMTIITSMLEYFPNTLHAKGPHGFTLLHHAQRGGDDAKEVAEYLVSLGAKETKIKLY